MAQFFPSYPIAGLQGASYNPRRIDPESLRKLGESLATVGMAKPIIVSGNLIVAGHQRMKSLAALGYTAAPAVVLADVTTTDEVRFNQLHNGTDFDSGDENGQVGPSTCQPFEFEELPADRLTANAQAKKLNIRFEICDLLLLYGNWGCCVATMSGEVIHAAQYAMACATLHMPIRVYRVPDALRDVARDLMGRQYGVFSYDHLERTTYMQTFAQLFRGRKDPLRAEGGRTRNARWSNLYEDCIRPELQPGERLLDFGCGQADELKMLQTEGVNAFGIEFYFRAGKQIDTAGVHRMIEMAAVNIATHGLFDVVVCDSVLNSTDSMQAEADVLACLNAFCKPGGRIYFSGRLRETVESHEQRKRLYARNKQRLVEFLDENGFSGTFREGKWFYQKFHWRAQAEALALATIGPGYRYTNYSSRTGEVVGTHAGNCWGTWGRKMVQLPDDRIRGAIAREFNLIWPGGHSVNRAELMLTAWEKARSL